MNSFIIFLSLAIPIILIIIAIIAWWKQDLIVYVNYFPRDSIGDYAYLPSLFSMKYDDVWIRTEDGVKINAWFIYAPKEDDEEYGKYFKSNDNSSNVNIDYKDVGLKITSSSTENHPSEMKTDSKTKFLAEITPQVPTIIYFHGNAGLTKKKKI